MAPSYTLVDCSFIQVPYFQLTQPEDQVLATHMAVSSTIPSVTIVPLYYLIINIFWPKPNSVPYRKLMHLICILVIITSIIMTIFWNTILLNISIIIYLTVFIGATIGNLQTIALLPWISSVNPILCAPVMVGNNIGILIGALLGLIQNPGDDGNQLFTPTVFFVIITFLLILSYIVWIYIDLYYFDSYIISPAINGGDDNNNMSIQQELTKSNKEEKEQQDEQEAEKEHDDKSPLLKSNDVEDISIETSDNDDIWINIKNTFSIPVWWRKGFIYLCYDVYLQFVVWVFFRSTLPFAAEHVATDDSGDGERILSYAINIGYVGGLLGSLFAIIVPINNFFGPILIFTAFVILFMWYLFDNNDSNYEWGVNDNNFYSQLLLVIDSFVLLFLNGYLTPLLFRRVGELYPSKGEEINRWIAGIEKIITFIMVWITYGLVTSNIIN